LHILSDITNKQTNKRKAHLTPCINIKALLTNRSVGYLLKLPIYSWNHIVSIPLCRSLIHLWIQTRSRAKWNILFTEFRTKLKQICCFCTKFDQYAANNWNIMRFLQSVYSFMRDSLHFINICSKTQQNQELQHCKKLGNFNEIEWSIIN
jgi:hypothetical protein